MSDANNFPIDHQQSTLLVTLRHVLKPFVRLLLVYGITYTMLLEELKRLYVKVADEEYQLGNKRQTDSRLTLLTGVHRKDIHRIRNEVDIPIIPKTNFGSQLIAQWIGNPKYRDSFGNPAVLPRYSKDHTVQSFESLVASVSTDIRARPVLDEWLRSGIVSLMGPDGIKLNTQAFIPKEDFEEKLFFLSMNVHDHLAAAVHNLQFPEKSMMERCVYYEGFSLQDIERLHTIVKQGGMEFLKLINQQSIDIQRQESDDQASKDQTSFRMNAGVYFYFEPTKHDDHIE